MSMAGYEVSVAAFGMGWLWLACGIRFCYRWLLWEMAGIRQGFVREVDVVCVHTEETI